MDLPGPPHHPQNPTRSPPGPHLNQSPEVIVDTIRRRVRVVVVNQERLSRSRSELLDRREEIRILVKEVQSLRGKAGDANSAFMSYLRTSAMKGTEGICLGKDVMFTKLYDCVESTRDRLGEKEDELERAGRALTAEELRFREEEDDFYQYDLPELFMREITSMQPPPPPPPPPPHPPPSISPLQWSHLLPVHLDGPGFGSPSKCMTPPPLPPPPPPPPSLPCPLSPSKPPRQFWWPLDKPKGFPFEHMNDDVEFDALGRQFGPKLEQLPPSPPGEKDMPLDVPSISESGGPPSFTISTISYPQELTSSDVSDVETEHTEHDEPSTEFGASIGNRRLSEPVKSKPNTLEAPQLLERSLSENAMFDVDHKPHIKNRIREWLLTLLRLDRIEKRRYMNILKDTLREHGFRYPIGLPCEEPATIYWSRDSGSSLGTASKDDLYSSDFGSKTNAHSSKDVGPNANLSQRRQSTRTRPDVEPLATEVLILDTNDPSEAEMDHPSFFPLPGSPSQETDEWSEMDDPSYFPLPPSLSSSMTVEDLSGNTCIESQPYEKIDVPLPPWPTKLSRNFTGPNNTRKLGPISRLSPLSKPVVAASQIRGNWFGGHQ